MMAGTTMNGDTNMANTNAVNAKSLTNGMIRFGGSDEPARDGDDGTAFPVVVVEQQQQGNLTIVMRNNRRKIDRDLVENLGFNRRSGKGALVERRPSETTTSVEAIEEELYNKVRPRGDQKAVAELMRRLQGEDGAAAAARGMAAAVGGTVNGGGICRPPYHYMYMVRKVASARRDANRSAEAAAVAAVRDSIGDNIVAARPKGDNGPPVMLMMSDNVEVSGGSERRRRSSSSSSQSSGASEFGVEQAATTMVMGTSPVVDVGQ